MNRPRRRLLSAGLLLLAAPARAERAVRDAAGRAARLPATIRRVFPAGPPAAILLYTLAPDVMAGWSARTPGPRDAPFMRPEAAALPDVGRLTGRDNTANMEAILRHRPDLVLDYGAVGQTYASLADRIAAQTGLPVLLLDGALTRIPETYRLLGDILDRAPAAAERAEVAARILEEAGSAAGALAARGRPRVLYVRGPQGLETGLGGSITTEILEFIGAENVAATALGRGGLARISMEQVLAWNPDWVIGSDPAFHAAAARDPLWRSLAAVRAGRLVLAPAHPFGWVDVPPSVNRLLGLMWLPALFGLAPREGLAERVAAFHALFYHRRPAPEDLAALLRPAFPA